jgi:hypothetical protein
MVTTARFVAALLATSLTFLGACAARGQEPAAADAALQRWALLVGVDDYAELADLQRPSVAIRQLQSRLTAAGFPVTNVFAVVDQAPVPKYLPSKANIERQLELITSLPRDNDLLIVALCGRVLHRDGKSYLCPLDASLANPEKTALDLDAVLQRLGGCAAKYKLLVVDGAPATDKDAPGTFDSLVDRWREPPAGMAVWLSCGQGEVSHAASSLDWTIFLHYLVRAWDSEGGADQAGNKDGEVSLREFVDYVSGQTQRQAKTVSGKTQTPVLMGQLPPETPLGHVAKFAAAHGSYPVIEDDVGTASARLEAISRINPQSLRAYNQALSAYGHGDLIEAINLATDALQYDHGNVWAHILRASCYAAYRDLAKAVDDYRELGIPLPCVVASENASLRDGDKVVAKLRPGDRVYAVRARGDWLFVEVRLVDGVKAGWIQQNKLE